MQLTVRFFGLEFVFVDLSDPEPEVEVSGCYLAFIAPEVEYVEVDEDEA